MDVISGKPSPEVSYDIDVVGGNLLVKVDFAGKELKSSLSAELGLVALLEKVKVAIPGTIDDAIIAAVQAFLLAQAPEAPKPE